jgi:predicted nucleic acid-binding protein
VIVVDASVLANVVADDGDDGRRARAAVRGEELAAPDLVDVETVAVLRKRWLADDLDDARFRDAVTDLMDLAITRHPMLSFMPSAYELRASLTPYDTVYVVLAEALGCPLVTSDQRLANAPGPRCQTRTIRS